MYSNEEGKRHAWEQNHLVKDAPSRIPVQIKEGKKVVNGRVAFKDNKIHVEIGTSYALVENLDKRASTKEGKFICLKSWALPGTKLYADTKLNHVKPICDSCKLSPGNLRYVITMVIVYVALILYKRFSVTTFNS